MTDNYSIIKEITQEEADAILHFLLNLIELKGNTSNDSHYYIDKVIKLIKECGASISSSVCYYQHNHEYVMHKINIDYTIRVDIANKYHMIHNGYNRLMPAEILDTSLIYDKRVMDDTTCLHKILSLECMKYYKDCKERVIERLREL